MKIRAAVYRDISGHASIETLDLAEPGEDEILVRVVATGVCHTDITSSRRTRSPRPIVLGHEGAGIVERVGRRVTKVARGDHVVMTYDACDRCPRCAAGHRTYCDEMHPLNFGGLGLDGRTPMSRSGESIAARFFGQSSFATMTIGTERNVIKVPKDVPLELLGPLGCGIQTGAGAIINALKIHVGSSVAIFGAGSVGLSAVMAARLMGAQRIIAVDILKTRLDLALELGASETINAREQDVDTHIRKILPRGVDFALETTGVPLVVQQAMSSLASLGTLGFVAPAAEPVSLNMRDFLFGKSVRGIIEGDSMPDLFIPRLIEFHKQGRFPFDKLVQFYTFERVDDAFQDSESGTAIKPILRMPN